VTSSVDTDRPDDLSGTDSVAFAVFSTGFVAGAGTADCASFVVACVSEGVITGVTSVVA
jgi:hypothetical protein